MLKLTKTGIGLLTRQYRSVLHKCWMINAGLFFALAPSAADATAVTDIFATLQQKSPHNIAWTGYSTTGTEGYDASTNKGVMKITVDDGDYYFSYTYNTPTGYTETSLPVTEFTAENVQNKVFEQITTGASSGVIRLSSNTDSDIPVISDFIGNIASDGIAKGSSIWLESAAIGDIKGNFIGNYINALSAQAEGGAIDVDTFITTGKQAKVGKIEGIFIGNHAIANGNGISAGGAVWSQSGSIIEDIHADFIGNYTLNTAGGQASGGAIFNNVSNEYGNIIHNIYDSTFTSNYAKSESGSASGGAIYNTGTIGISAKNTDTVFRDNKTIVGSSFSYNDVHNMGTLHLNAASGRAIDFGGSITGSGTLNINNGYEGAATGGKYIFRSDLNANTLNIGGGAYISFGSLLQKNGNTTRGRSSSTYTNFTSDGIHIDSYNGTLDGFVLGNVSVEKDVAVSLEGNLCNGSGCPAFLETIHASDYSGDGRFVLEEIWLHAENPNPVETTHQIADSVVAGHIIKATSGVRVLGENKTNAYDVNYDSLTGILTLTPNGGGDWNLRGFLAKDTSGTSYTLSYDEKIISNIGDMISSPKTVNAGNYTINGNQHAGVTVKSGQTLNINGGIWDGFVRSGSYGGMIFQNHDLYNEVKISGSTIQNNSAGKGGGALLVGGVSSLPQRNNKLTIENSRFLNNTAKWGGAVDNEASVLNITNSEFSNNKVEKNASGTDGKGGAIITGGRTTITDTDFINNNAESLGGAIYSYGRNVESYTTVSAANKNVVFSNNTAGTSGGAIYNNGTTTISATGGDVKFENNQSGDNGGAIYNEGTLKIKGTDDYKIKFENNYSAGFGGAIYSTGHTLDLIENAIFRGNSIAESEKSGGAIYSRESIGKITNSYFENNYGGRHSGAVDVENGATEISYTVFKNNYAEYNTSFVDGVLGGAVLNAGNIPSTTVATAITHSIFENNYAKSQKLQARGGAYEQWKNGSTRLIEDTRFEGNHAISVESTAVGGAIENMNIITSIIGSTFLGNYAESNDMYALGGAINNNGTITNVQNSSFSGNYVSGNDDSKGGAIYNSGNIGFSGTNTFTDNKANEAPNDIYNSGTININGGTTTLNSGYVGSETSALTVKSGATLTANAALEVADGGTLTNESGGTLAVSADNLKIDETTNNGTLELEGGNVTTKLMGAGRMKLMSGNVRLLSSTPPATTGSLSFGDSSDYVDSILTSSSAASTSDHALVTAGYLSNNYYTKENLPHMQLIDFNRYFKIKGLMKNGRFLDDKSVTFDAEKAENVPASEMRFNTAKSMGKESKMPHNSPTGEGTTLNILRKFNVVLDSLSQLAANDNASKTTNSNSDDKTNVLSAPTVASTSLLFRVKNKEVIDGSYKNVQFYKAINDNFTKDATTTILRAI